MVKKLRPIDGFVVRGQGSGSVPSRQPKIIKHSNRINVVDDVQSAKISRGNKSANRQPKSIKSDSDKSHPSQDEIDDDKLMSDIESTLSNIDDLPQPEESHIKRHRRKGDDKSKQKKKLTKGKIVKRAIIILVLALLGVLGYLGVKAILAGGKIFKGNPLSMFTTKTRLAEDSNGRTNILVFGTSGYSMNENAWDGAMLTDSIMVLSVDQDKDNVYMMSLPRDLYVKHTCPILGTTSGKLNETFYCAYKQNNNDEAAGAKALMSKAGDILGLDIQYYIHADWTALTQAVDAVGGVDVTIESTDSRGIYDSSTKLRYKNGEVAHLDGQKALALARARNHNAGDYGLSGGNYDREKNQQKILKALQEKALSAGTLANPVAVNNLIDSLGNNLITDFESSHIQTLIDIAKNMKSDKMIQLPFVGREDGGADLIASYSEGGSYKGEAPVAGPFDYAEIQKYIAKNLSSDPVVQEGAIIDVLNGSDQSGLASDKADELEKAKYTIGNIANAPVTVSDKVVIYQLSSDKSGTATALKKKYGVDIKQGALDGYKTKADFVIVFGQGSAGSVADTSGSLDYSSY